MSREPRPHVIFCSVCENTKPSRHAREYQGAWAKPFDGDGTHTDPQALDRTGICVCADCWTAHDIYGGSLPETAAEAKARAYAALENATPKVAQGGLL